MLLEMFRHSLTRHCTPIISLIPILTIKVTAGHVLRLNNVDEGMETLKEINSVSEGILVVADVWGAYKYCLGRK